MSAESANELLSELVELVREQLLWQRAASMPVVSAALENALQTSKMRRAYDLCDGLHTFREIATETGISLGTVSAWSKKWRESGLVFEDSSGRMRHLIGLGSLGLPVDVDPVPADAGQAGESGRRGSR